MVGQIVTLLNGTGDTCDLSRSCTVPGFLINRRDEKVILRQWQYHRRRCACMVRRIQWNLTCLSSAIACAIFYFIVNIRYDDTLLIKLE